MKARTEERAKELCEIYSNTYDESLLIGSSNFKINSDWGKIGPLSQNAYKSMAEHVEKLILDARIEELKKVPLDGKTTHIYYRLRDLRKQRKDLGK